MKAITALPVTELVPSPLQYRKTMGGLEELAESIRQVGVLQRLVVRQVDGHHEIVCGERRWRAAQLAGLTSVPVDVRELTDVQVRECQLVENASRKDVHPMEESDAFAALHKEHHYAAEDIAAKVGKSKGYVYGRLKLQELCPAGRDAFAEDRLTAGAALALTRVDAKAQAKALKEVQKWGRGRILSSSDINQVLRQHQQSLTGAPFDVAVVDLLPNVGACASCPKRSGAQADLFGQLDDDGPDPNTCFDVACFRRKIEATWERTREQAEARGQQVLKTEVALTEYGSTQRGYVRADATHPDCYLTGHHAKSQTWKQLVGKTLKPSLVQDPKTGATVEVYESRAASKALPEEFKKAKAARASSTKPTTTAGALDLGEALRLTEERYLQAMVAAAEQMQAEEVIRILAEDALTGYDDEQFMRALGWDVTVKEGLDERLGGSTVAELRALALLPVAASHGHANKVLERRTGASRKTLQKAVEKELREKAKLAARAKKEAAKVSKKKAPAAKKAKKAAPLKGVCRTCGCTDTTPCERGCAWTDQTETLCTACVP